MQGLATPNRLLAVSDQFTLQVKVRMKVTPMGSKLNHLILNPGKCQNTTEVPYFVY